MPSVVSILRGINVSGQKKIKMADLKTMYENMDFTNVTTYIQSGNVAFTTKSDKNISQKIEEKIKETFSFDVPVIVLSKEELKTSINKNPFLTRKGVEADRLYITFLQENPKKEYVEKVTQLNFFPEEFFIKEKVVYLYCPAGYGNTKLNNNFFENKLKVKATTRNLKTSNKLVEILEEYK